MWARVFKINEEKGIGFCISESGQKFIFGLKCVPDEVALGDIVQFRPHSVAKELPPWPDGKRRSVFDQAENIKIIGYTVFR